MSASPVYPGGRASCSPISCISTEGEGMASRPVEPACTMPVHSTPVLSLFWQVQTLRAAQGELCWEMPLGQPQCLAWTEPNMARQLRCREPSIFPYIPHFALHDACCVCFISLFEQAATRSWELCARPDPGASSDGPSSPYFSNKPHSRAGHFLDTQSIRVTAG